MAMITTKKEMMIDSNEKTDSNDDSKQPVLVFDVLISILERLSFVDFRRARCISSGWYSASKSCIQGRTNPWLIFFGEIKNDTCKLFDPRDKNSYTVRHLGFDFARSRFFASSGSWFLMFDSRSRILHLLNLFTRERISLPSLESIDGSEMTLMTTGDSVFYVALDYKDKACRKLSHVMITAITIHKAVLWVDEKSRDYLVVWSNGKFLAYHKRGDNNNESWKVLQHLKNEGCVDMVFKESKLYVLRTNRVVTVFDFSHGESPMECASFPSPLWNPYPRDYFENLAVTLSGEVLIISSRVEPYPERCFFNIYKMDPESSEWRIIESIENETLLLDLGITVAAKGGVAKNCIYFSNDHFRRYNYNRRCYDDNKGICVYNIKTKKVFKVFEHLFASDARWFFPTFGGE